MRLIDSHAHLQAPAFAGDLPAVLAAASAAGVARILVPGWDRASSEEAIRLVETHPWLDAAVGIHPHGAEAATDADWSAICRLAADPRVVAIGETGLDFDRLFSPADAQLANLRRHLALAVKTGKPAILHCRSAAGQRNAQDALLAALDAAGFGQEAARRAFGDRPGAVLHSFSGPIDYAESALGMGLAISISGLAFRHGEDATAVVAGLVPADRLLVETDCPYLAPPGAPHRRNAPEWVRVTARWVAEVRRSGLEELGQGLVDAYDATFPRPSQGQPDLGLPPAEESSMTDRSYLDRNAASRRRLEALVARLGAADVGRSSGEGSWTVGQVLGHLSFWDRFLAERWNAGLAAGLGQAIVIDERLPDVLNPSLAPIFASFSEHAWEAVAAQAVAAARSIDELIAGLPDETPVGEIQRERPNLIDRSVHRNQHLDQIERALG